MKILEYVQVIQYENQLVDVFVEFETHCSLSTSALVLSKERMERRSTNMNCAVKI